MAFVRMMEFAQLAPVAVNRRSMDLNKITCEHPRNLRTR